MRFLRLCFAFALLAGVCVPGRAQRFSAWSVPVNIGGTVNTAEYAELGPAISKDGLSLFFHCLRGTLTLPCPDGDGIYVSQRMSLYDAAGNPAPWGPPQFVMPGGDMNLTIDGHRMYFAMNGDIFVTRRHNTRDDFGWDPPEYLSAINSAFDEGSAFFFEDEATGAKFLYFSSKRTDLGGPGDMDIYVSTLQQDETWGPPVLVSELSTPYFDNHPVLRRDGLEIFFVSNRPGSFLNAQGKPSNDIWTSTRASTSDPWSPPVNVDADAFGNLVSNINTGRHDAKPSLSFDGTTLYYGTAQRPGNFGVGCPYAATCYFDIWVATREKLTGKKD